MNQEANRARALMRDVQSVFGRSLTHLPVVFGVPRQTLYNWLGGETPREVYHDRIIQLAAAAHVFSTAHFAPTAPMLDRTLVDGKSFLTLLAEGADGAETASYLMKVVNRDRAADARFDAALPGRPKSTFSASDFGADAFDEDPE